MRFVTATRIATCCAFTGATLAARHYPKAVDALILAATLTVGVGHGAADDTLLAERLVPYGDARRAIGVAYAAAAVAVFAAARSDAAVTRAALRLLTWFHFGSGDVAFTTIGRKRALQASRWLLSGAIPLVSGIVSLRTFATALAGTAAVADARRGAWDAAADIAVPALTFALAPHDRTFAAYFAFWHAPRHIAVIVERDADGGRHGVRLRRFAVAAAPNTAIALAAGGAAMLLGCRARANLEPAILAITVPHLVAVALLDACERRTQR